MKWVEERDIIVMNDNCEEIERGCGHIKRATVSR